MKTPKICSAICSLIFSTFFSTSAFSQQPYLIKDLNTSAQRIYADLSGTNKIVINNKLIFIAEHPVYGVDLFRVGPNDTQVSLHAELTPGNQWTEFRSGFMSVQGRTLIMANEDLYRVEDSPQGAVLVKGDGVGFSRPIYSWFVWNNYLYFLASDDSSNFYSYGLWRSDGTDAGTVLIKALNAGSSGSGFWGEVGGKLVFDSGTSSSGYEPWITDGTAQGTTILKDIHPGVNSSLSDPIGLLQGYFYFTSDNGTTGTEIWRTNGTPAGTQLFKEVITGSGGIYGSSRGFADSNLPGFMFFALELPNEGREMWRTDGTPQGTTQLINIAPGLDHGVSGFRMEEGIAFLPGKFLFIGSPQSNDQTIYASDGTPGGTTSLFNISNTYDYGRLTKHGSKVFFNDSEDHGGHLWSTDGTIAGTQKFIDKSASHPYPFGGGAGFVFSVYDDDSGSEPWISDGIDGTPAHTHIIKDLSPGTDSGGMGKPFSFAGSNYFECDFGLCKTDGTEAGTSTVTSFYTPYTESSYASPFFTFEQKVWFRAYQDASPNRWWSTDGTPDNISPLPTLLIGNPLRVGQKVFFNYNWLDQNDYGWQKLIISDGTESGTSLVRDGLRAVGGESSYTGFGSIGDTYLFSGGEGSGSPIGIMKSDGTYAGTSLLAPGYMGGIDWNPSASLAMQVGSVSLFSMDGSGSNTGMELWKTDGTVQGTSLLKDIEPGEGSSYPLIGDEFSVVLNNVGYFKARVNQEDALWRSDGTPAGTWMVKSLSGGSVSRLFIFGSSIYFFVEDYPNPDQLWKSDGTEAGTVLVTNIGNSGINFSKPEIFNGKFYFSASSSSAGNELWVSDGTAAGSVLFKDIRPGAESGNPYGLHNMGTRLLFIANDGTHGFEMWETDGTQEGTHLVKDIFGGPDNAFPDYDQLYGDLTIFHQLGSRVVFSAQDLEHGSELWGYSVDGSFQPTPTPSPTPATPPVPTNTPSVSTTPPVVSTPSQLNLASVALTKPKLTQKKGAVKAEARAIQAPVTYIFSYYEKPKSKLPKGKKLKIKTKRSPSAVVSLGKYKKGVTLVVNYQVEMIGTPGNRSSTSPNASIKVK